MKKKPIRKKLTLSLSERESQLLSLYAADQGTAKSVAVKRLLKTALSEYAKKLSTQEPANQLGLFDSIQYDIFNNTSKGGEEN